MNQKNLKKGPRYPNHKQQEKWPPLPRNNVPGVSEFKMNLGVNLSFDLETQMVEEIQICRLSV